jgi:hypothetical protein
MAIVIEGSNNNIIHNTFEETLGPAISLDADYSNITNNIFGNCDFYNGTESYIVITGSYNIITNNIYQMSAISSTSHGSVPDYVIELDTNSEYNKIENNILHDDGVNTWTEVIDNSGNTTNIVNINKICLINYLFNGGGSVISTGVYPFIIIPWDCTLISATLLSNQTGSIVVDFWKDSYANFPPTNDNSITASTPPTISSSNKSLDTTLTGWSKTLLANDILVPNVDSVSTFTDVTLVLKVVRNN